MRTRRGFTLIELITVMTITAILLTIITVPIIQSFNLTRAAQGFADAQDRARLLIDRISREISNSAGVRDNSGPRGALDIRVPGQNGAQEIIRIENAKLDIVKPSQGEENIDPNNPGLFINPVTGKVDPTLRSPKGQVTLPVAPGATLVRYFIGLKRPFALDLQGNRLNTPAEYNNGYDGILMLRNGRPDNLYVLWRAEVQPFRWVAGTRTVNTDLFDVDPNTGEPVYDDPQFFLPDGSAAKALRVQNWLNRSAIVTEFSRYDMIQAMFDRRTRVPIYDGNVPRVFPLVQFTPKRQTSEPPIGMMAVRSGEESTNSAKIGPDVYRTNFGGWTDTFIRTWPGFWPVQFGYGGRIRPSDNPSNVFADDQRSVWRRQDSAGAQLNPYVIGDLRFVPAEGPAPGYSIFAFDPSLGGERTPAARTELFRITEYRNDVRNNVPYPFTRNLANNVLTNQALRQLAVLYTVEPKGGQVITSFGIEEVGQNPPPNPLPDNRPVAATGLAYTPANDNTIGGGSWFSYGTINQRFNKLWNDWATIFQNNRSDPSQDPLDLPRERFCKRYVDLRVLPQADGTPSPLHPTEGFPRASIVPGSEVVLGPDQNPGPNYGELVRYTRVTQRPVGVNQYYINYVDQREPNWEDWDGPNGGGTQGIQTIANVYDPTTYNGQDFVSAVFQPQFRKGYLEFNSRFGEPLPNGNILIYYRFQFTEPSDTFAIDYDTRQVIDINLTIRNYPQTNLPNGQTITVQGSASVRNFIR